MKYCLIGNPINHSLSPKIHFILGKEFNFPIEYSLEEGEKINIEYLKENYAGFNVTMPFKETIIPFIHELSNISQKIKSVNTVKVSQGKLIGHSTDGEGFVKDFKRAFNTDFYNKKVCILGTGGTCKAISYSIKEQNPKYLIFYSTTKTGENIFSYKDQDLIKDCNVIINTTPVGMKENKCVLDQNIFQKNMLVYDVIYNQKTLFLDYAQKQGAKICDGFGMLLYQGALSEMFWFEENRDEKIIHKLIGERYEKINLQRFFTQ